MLRLMGLYPQKEMVAAILLIGSASGFSADLGKKQSWTDKSGKVIEAEFVRLDEGAVVIEKDGKQFTVPFSKLDDTSLKQARSLAKPMPELNPASIPELEATPSPAPAATTDGEMASIPGGTFTMGDTFDSKGQSNYQSKPHEVTISGFRLAKYETTREEWERVHKWAISHGYSDLAAGAGIESKHPVYQISWFDAVKWCNARSEMEGLSPCYHIDSNHSAPFRTGIVPLTPDHVSWDSNGYRLPTEAEWEFAARGGLKGKRFPTGDTISHEIANFKNRPGVPYQSGTLSYHPVYKTGTEPYTAPVGSFAPNAYGLHDMAGNLSEYCWDFFAVYQEEPQVNPRGPQLMGSRVIRGGSWISDPDYCTVWIRTNIGPTNSRETFLGFRTARKTSP